MKVVIPLTEPAGVAFYDRAAHSRRRERHSSVYARSICVLLSLLPLRAAGQFVPASLPSYEGQNVSSIELAGRPELDAAKYLPLLQQHPDSPLSVEQINSSVAALKDTKEFQDVRLELQPEAEGVRVLLVLEPALYIGIFSFPGAVQEFQYSRLLQISNYQSQEPYTTAHVRQAQAALSEFYNRNGFFQAEVKPELKIDQAHGIVNIMFASKLGRRARFGKIDIQGASTSQTAKLQHDLRTVMAVLRGDSIKTGKPFSLGRLEHATSYLQGRLGKLGYLTAQVKFVAAEYDPKANRADLHFTVKAGPTVRITVKGEHLWPWSRNRLIPMYSEHSMDEDLIDEGQKNLTSYLQTQGYFDARVKADSHTQDSTQAVIYEVTKGKRSKVGAVGFAGNRHFPEKELQEHVTVKKKMSFDPFSHGHFSQQLLQGSVSNLVKFYRNSGFSEVKVTSAVKADAKGDVHVTFQVDEGTQDVVTNLHIVGNDSVPANKLTPHGLKLGPGKPYSGSLVSDDRNEVIAGYLRKGYLLATFQSKAAVDKKKPHNVDVTYEIKEGPQVITAAVITEGKYRTQQWLIDKSLQIRASAPLSENDVLASETKLYSLNNVFDWASIDPRAPVTEQPHADVLVKEHEAKPNTITYSFGFEALKRGGNVPGGTIAIGPVPTGSALANFTTSERTFYGPTGGFSYTRNNVLGSAQSFTLAGFAGPCQGWNGFQGCLDQRGSGTYTIPYFRRTDWQVSGTISGEFNQTNPIFSNVLAGFDFQFQHALNPKKTRTVFLRYDARIDSVTSLVIPALIPQDQRFVRLSGPTISFVDDSRDNPLDAHHGLYNSYEVGVNPKFLGSNFSFAHFLGQSAYYRTLPFGNVVWATSLRLGIDDPIEGSLVPLQETFFSGGGSTLRGSALLDAGPQRPICVFLQANATTCTNVNIPAGGLQLLIINEELRWPLPIKKGLSLVTFYDGGNVFSRIGFHGGCGVAEHDEGVVYGCGYTNTVGAGLRYATPIGPIRVDLGRNLKATPGLSATQYFITVGQAF